MRISDWSSDVCSSDLDVCDNEIDIPEALHFDFAGDLRISRLLTRPAMFDDLCQKIDSVESLRTDENQLWPLGRFPGCRLPKTAHGIRLAGELCAALGASRLNVRALDIGGRGTDTLSRPPTSYLSKNPTTSQRQ